MLNIRLLLFDTVSFSLSRTDFVNSMSGTVKRFEVALFIVFPVINSGTRPMVNTEDLHAGYDSNEALLRSEIGFWREMIDTCRHCESRDSVERMEQALALAESRLAQLFEQYRAAALVGSDRPSNVYSLDQRRR